MKKIFSIATISCFLLIGSMSLSGCRSSGNNKNTNTGSDSEKIQVREVRTVKNAAEISNPKYKTVYSYVENNVFYSLIYLGYVENVPLENYFTIAYNGGTQSFSKSTSETVSSKISDSTEYTSSTSTTTIDEKTWSWHLDGHIEGEFKFKLMPGIYKNSLKVGVEGGYSKGGTNTTEKTDSESFSTSYEKSSEWSKTNAFTFTASFDESDKYGYYRYNLFGTVDYFAALVIDLSTNECYTDNIGYVNSSYFGWEYSTSSLFDDKEYQKLTFDESLLDEIDYSLLNNTDVWDGTTASSFSSGNGTIEKPYVINSAEELAYFSNFIKDEKNNSKNFVLNKNIDLNNIKWEPLSPFYGTFDGNNYSIRNLSIEKKNVDNLTPTEANAYYIGFFQFIYGTVKNLRIIDADVSVKYSDGRLRTGILSGGVINGKLENCTVNGYLDTISNDLSGTYTLWNGGLVGYGENSSISDCSSSIAITISGRCILNVGGLIGRTSGMNIQRCSSSGKISTESSVENTTYNSVGGFVGRTTKSENPTKKTTISNSFSDVQLTSNKMGGNLYLGGFVGSSIDSEITYSYASGDVSGKNINGNCYTSGFSGETINTKINSVFTISNIINGGTNSFFGRILAKESNNSELWNLNYSQSSMIPDNGVETKFETDWYLGRSLAIIKSSTFQTEIVSFDESIWNIVNGQLPTLKKI